MSRCKHIATITDTEGRKWCANCMSYRRMYYET